MAREYLGEGVIGRDPIFISIKPPPADWSSLAIYAPAIPGIVVAVCGLWIAHRLTVSRDRRKEISELCEDLKEMIDKASDATSEAWLADRGPQRPKLILVAKTRIQAVGTAATNLKRRSASQSFISWPPFRRRSIDLLTRISELRKLSTSDPFEEPDRKPDHDKAADIASLSAEIQADVDAAFAELYSHR